MNTLKSSLKLSKSAKQEETPKRKLAETSRRKRKRKSKIKIEEETLSGQEKGKVARTQTKTKVRVVSNPIGVVLELVGGCDAFFMLSCEVESLKR
ncbi:hypothetical protein K1719_017535 [Acacia pycnantha]|nr:hypothetical protein K1719_017535 [Acacia pycnantha]